jgi:CubicO group peptidase (beta-lactamase class C family)
MKSLVLISFFLITTGYSQQVKLQEASNAVENTTDSIDRFIQKKMDESGMVGLAAAIIINKKLVWTKGYGYADLENKIPFTPKTIMNIGSISKTITGVSMMQAIEEKKIALDEDINTYLPFKMINPYFPNERISLRNLATHTSGIVDQYPLYSKTYHYGSDSPEELGEFLKNYFEPKGKYYSPDNFLKHKPGSYREYSNIATGLAGYIIENTTGQKLNTYSKQHIFTPLKMNDTGWFLSEINLANHSKLYENQRGIPKLIPLYGLTTYPDGGVRTSVADLSKFFICLLNDGAYDGRIILEKESVNQMLQFQFTTLNKPENVNLEELNSGLFWATKRNLTRIGHSGTDPGVKTVMLSDASKEIGVLLFTNTSLDEEATNKFGDIYNELYANAVKLKSPIGSH